jgi:hypothetical protein
MSASEATFTLTELELSLTGLIRALLLALFETLLQYDTVFDSSCIQRLSEFAHLEI